eukprot:13551693-Heterocapsa_arctica.AAC.1
MPSRSKKRGDAARRSRGRPRSRPRLDASRPATPPDAATLRVTANILLAGVPGLREGTGDASMPAATDSGSSSPPYLATEDMDLDVDEEAAAEPVADAE